MAGSHTGDRTPGSGGRLKGKPGKDGKALVIVDLQNDFSPGGAIPVPGGHEIVSRINRLQEYFSVVVATKDWHPPRHVSFAETHGRKAGEIINAGGIRQQLWPEHCVQGSTGAEFVPGLKTDGISKVIYKGTEKETDSYSAFFDNARVNSTGLMHYLKSEGIEQIFICGLAFDFCVRWTTLDGRELGLKVRLVRDATRAAVPGNEEDVVAALKRAGVEICTTEEVIREREK